MSTTFGELTGQAQAHLRAAARGSYERGPNDDPRQLLGALDDCLRAVQLLQQLGVSARPPWPDPDKSWRIAARELTASLTGARLALAGLPADQELGASWAALHVQQAAALIGAGHDLLATHLDHRRPSDLAALVSDHAGRRQVTVTAATLTGAVADVLGTDVPGDLPPPSTRTQAARQHLRWGAGIVTAAAGRAIPTPDYLAAVSGLEPLRRVPAGAPEPRDELLQQIRAGAQRLHAAAMRDSERGPAAYHQPDSLRTVAAAMTASHAITAQLLSQLTGPASTLTPPLLAPDAVTGVIEAAREEQRAFRAWLAVRDAWQDVRGLADSARSSGLQLDANDLVTRLGRVTYRDAGWEPRVGMSATLRDPAELAPDRAALAALTQTVHELTAVSALLAAEHARLSHSIAGSGQLLVPTATLSDEHDVPRLFAHIPDPARKRLARALARAYDGAARSAADAAAAISSVALLADTASPSLGRRQQIELTTLRLAARDHRRRPAPPVRAALEIEL